MALCKLLCVLVSVLPSNGKTDTIAENLSVWECHAKYLRETNAIVDVLEVHPSLKPPKFECREMYTE